MDSASSLPYLLPLFSSHLPFLTHFIGLVPYKYLPGHLLVRARAREAEPPVSAAFPSHPISPP